MTLHSPVHIGKVIRHAVVFNPKKRDGSLMNTDSLLSSVERLLVLLCERKIDFVLVGGIALLQYVEGRNTEDIDLIMALSSLKKLPEIHLTSQDVNFARGTFEHLQIDFLLTSNPLFAKVQRQHTTPQVFAEQTIPTATVEGLILLKLYALPSLYRQGNFAKVGIYENDVATLLYAYQPKMEGLIKELSRFLDPHDLKEVEGIVGEIQGRIARFRRGNPPSAAE
jgi:hypothetical protein